MYKVKIYTESSVRTPVCWFSTNYNVHCDGIPNPPSSCERTRTAVLKRHVLCPNWILKVFPYFPTVGHRTLCSHGHQAIKLVKPAERTSRIWSINACLRGIIRVPAQFTSKNSCPCEGKLAVGHFTWRPKYVLLLPVTLQRHNFSLKWKGIGLLG
jgi:hypothetical protein